MPKITEMFAFVVADKNENDEGVLGTEINGNMVPLVGADLRRIKSLIRKAEGIKLIIGKDYKILKFKLVGEIDKNELS